MKALFVGFVMWVMGTVLLVVGLGGVYEAWVMARGGNILWFIINVVVGVVGFYAWGATLHALGRDSLKLSDLLGKELEAQEVAHDER